MFSIKEFYKKYERFVVLLGGVLLNISIGSIYTYNYMSPYLVQYMQNKSYHNNINQSSILWIFLANLFGMGSSVTFGDYIRTKFGTSRIIFISGWLMSINIMLMSITLKTNIIVVILTYGVFNGILSGIVYGVTMGAVCSWFSNRKGLIIGILVAGFGLSSFIFEFIQFGFLREKSSKDWQNKILGSYILVGAICMGLQVIGALMIKTSPPNISKNLDQSISQSYLLNHILEEIEFNLNPYNLIYEVDFWLMWISYSLLSASIIMIMAFSKELGLKFISLEVFFHKEDLTICLETLSSAVGCIIWGLAIDKFGYKIVIIVLTVSLSIFSGSFYSILNLNYTVNRSLINIVNAGGTTFYLVWIVFLSFIPSGVFVIFPQICAKLFGNRNFIANYGLLYTAWSAGAVIAGSISFKLWSEINKDTKKSEQYLYYAFISITILALLSTVINLFFCGKVRLKRKFQLT